MAQADVWTYFNQAFRLQKQGKIISAIEVYEMVLEMNPAHADALFNLGCCYLPGLVKNIGPTLKLAEEQQYFVAANYLNMLVNLAEGSGRLAPKHIKAYLHLGQALFGLKQYASAVHCFQKALELTPHNTEALRFIDLTRDYAKHGNGTIIN